MRTAKKTITSMSAPVRPFIVVALVVSLSACSWNDSRTETIGGVLGGIVGAVVGSKLGKGTGRSVTVVIGATLGAMWGQDIAKEMTSTDKIFSKRTTEDALEDAKPGETATWSNPDSGNAGSTTPDHVYTNTNGENCRQFETTVNVDGDEQTAQGTACKSDDGQWRIVAEPERAT